MGFENRKQINKAIFQLRLCPAIFHRRVEVAA